MRPYSDREYWDNVRQISQDIFECLGDYYHRDETEDLHGPFATEAIAREKMKAYVEWLMGDPE